MNQLKVVMLYDLDDKPVVSAARGMLAQERARTSFRTKLRLDEVDRRALSLGERYYAVGLAEGNRPVRSEVVVCTKDGDKPAFQGSVECPAERERGGAGLAAASLSGFANFQAFSLGVADPSQAQVWGWSGVIASICSFGGFTFFWWHMSGGRRGEALRALVFALAGAGTSVAGTSLFMMNNEQGQLTSWQTTEQLQVLTQAEIDDWTRQLQGIPAETRSIAGLEAYLAGVEAAGRTHQKPYRDAQNELGLAKRRATLEANIATAREQLRADVEARIDVQPARSLPAWFFALMLELFSSQATSIAFVSLLLLYGRSHARQARADLVAA